MRARQAAARDGRSGALAAAIAEAQRRFRYAAVFSDGAAGPGLGALIACVCFDLLDAGTRRTLFDGLDARLGGGLPIAITL